MESIAEIFNQFEFWHWLSLGLLLIIVEITMIGAYFLLWVGASAALVGIIMLIAPELSWQAQLTIWALGSMAGIAGWVAYRKKNPVKASDEPLLNQRGAQNIGRTLTLEEDLKAGAEIQVKLDDTLWTATSTEDLKAGQAVKVIEAKSTMIKLEKVE